jgi:hypothetical protein
LDSLYYEHQFNSNNHYLPVHLSFPQQQQQQQQQTTMTMTTRFAPLLMALLCLLVCQQQVEAFAGQSSMVNKQPFTTAQSRSVKNINARSSSSTTTTTSAVSSTTSLNAFPGVDQGSDMLLSATTLDPTTFFSNVLGLFLNTPIILAVPIVVGVAVAGTLAWLIVAYASPAEDN